MMCHVTTKVSCNALVTTKVNKVTKFDKILILDTLIFTALFDKLDLIVFLN
jgi:hypothetical protein